MLQSRTEAVVMPSGRLRVEILAVAEAGPQRHDHRHEKRGDDASGEPVVIEIEARVQRPDRQRCGRVDEARDDSPSEAEAAGDWRERRSEQRRKS
jgi:hypothetical protein